MDVEFTPDQLTGLTVDPGSTKVEVHGTPNQGAVGSIVTSLIHLSVANVTVGDGSGHLSRVQGKLDITQPSGPIKDLIVDGSAEPGKQSVTISPGTISGLAPADITYPENDLEAIRLKGGTGGNTFRVVATLPGDPVDIDGGSGANTLIGPDLKQTWNITSNDAGNLGNVTFSRVGGLTGGNRADTFLPSDGAILSGKVDGGGGKNTLDLSKQTRNVAVDLRSGEATGNQGRGCQPRQSHRRPRHERPRRRRRRQHPSGRVGPQPPGRRRGDRQGPRRAGRQHPDRRRGRLGPHPHRARLPHERVRPHG